MDHGWLVEAIRAYRLQRWHRGRRRYRGRCSKRRVRCAHAEWPSMPLSGYREPNARSACAPQTTRCTPYDCYSHGETRVGATAGTHGPLPSTFTMDEGNHLRDETHRDVAVEAYRAYASGKLPVTTLNLRGPISPRILAQGQRAMRNPSFASLLTPTEPHGILYIGGHTSGKDTMRFMKMINACRRAEDTYIRKRYAENDKWHAHKVANMLTTGLLRTGFSIRDWWILSMEGKYMASLSCW